MPPGYSRERARPSRLEVDAHLARDLDVAALERDRRVGGRAPPHRGRHRLRLEAHRLVGAALVNPTGGEIPVVAGLVAAGAGFGVKGVLLITMPALSIPSILMVARTFSWPVTAAGTTVVVAGGLVAKLVRRHPHVFAAGDASTPEEVEAAWARIKAEERAGKHS